MPLFYITPLGLYAMLVTAVLYRCHSCVELLLASWEACMMLYCSIKANDKVGDHQLGELQVWSFEYHFWHAWCLQPQGLTFHFFQESKVPECFGCFLKKPGMSTQKRVSQTPCVGVFVIQSMAFRESMAIQEEKLYLNYISIDVQRHLLYIFLGRNLTVWVVMTFSDIISVIYTPSGFISLCPH